MFEGLLAPEDPAASVGVGQIVLNSREVLHVLTRLERRPELALAIVCRGQSNLGLVLAKLGRLVRTTSAAEPRR